MVEVVRVPRLGALSKRALEAVFFGEYGPDRLVG